MYKRFIKRVLSFLIVFVALLCNLCAENNSTYNCVVLETIKGEMFEFRFFSNPCLTQNKDTVIMTDNEKKVELVMGEVSKIYFSTTNTSIKKIDGAINGSLVLHEGCIYLSSFTPGEQIVVYNLAGQKILRKTITSQGTLSIPFSDIPKGMAIIKSSNQSFKFFRK